MDSITLEVTHEKHVRLVIPAGLVPDMQVTYDQPGSMLRPTTGAIWYYKGSTDSEWRTSKVTISGRNVKKDGTTGVIEKHSRFFGELGLPGWLTDIVRENKPTV